MLSPVELPSAKSTRAIACSLVQWFAHHPFRQGDSSGKLVVVFDDACHLKRWIQRQANDHPKLQEFLDQVCAVACCTSRWSQS